VDQSHLHLRDQSLLSSLLIDLVKAIGIDHCVKLCEAGQYRGNRGDDTKDIGSISKDRKCAQVLLVGDEGKIGREIQCTAIDQVEDVGKTQEGNWEVNGNRMYGMA
jgi:hypothetical protein